MDCRPRCGQLQIGFVSVNAERDTLEIMRDYVDYFNPMIIGLTGALEQVTTMAKDR
ncbi:MAG: SCO family protein [Devosia marina]|uniref:SCO family protein n=1 Tax=Devosia marina TaxID=2683198 RepID=UPI0032ED94D6